MFSKPSFLIQHGYGGEDLAVDTVNEGYADGVIISPTDIDVADSRQFAGRLHSAGTKVLFDPQFYHPRSDETPLSDYPYFSEFAGGEPDHGFFGESGFDTALYEDDERLQEFCERVANFQADIDVDAYIAPARTLESLSDASLRHWRDMTNTFAEVVQEKEGEGAPIFASLPLSADLILEGSERDTLLNWVTPVEVTGFYTSLGVEDAHSYPLTGTENLYAYLDLVLNLKRNRFEVLLGHTHHVAHLFLGIGANAFASGHYLNTRRFDIDRWKPTDNSGGQQIISYYSEPLLNDLRVRAPALEEYSTYSDLDLLMANGADLRRIRGGTDYDAPVFTAATPSESDWPQRNGSWNHYLARCFDISRQYHENHLVQEYENEEIADLKDLRVHHTEERLEFAKQLHEDLTEDVILSTDYEEKIYADWPTVFERIKEEV